VKARFQGVGAALLFALLGAQACKAGEGDRCICAEDCRDGLVCLAGGRVLAADTCSAAIGPGAELGMCVEEAGAGEGDEGVPEPEIYLDLGSKRDFEPGIPPEVTSSESGDASSTGTATSTATSTSTDSGTASESGSGSGSGSGSSSDSGSTATGSESGSSGSGSSSSSG
jgi:hypothetical protein